MCLLTAPQDTLHDKWRTLLLLSLAELLAMSVWFSASAVVPVFIDTWDFSDSGKSWLTMSVQTGFVVEAFAFLALGPLVGIWAMLTLHQWDSATRLANGH